MIAMWLAAVRTAREQTAGGLGQNESATGFFTMNDVWRSRDGVEWTRCVEHAPWARAQSTDRAAVERERGSEV